jgi:ubiquinone/menaquinone biosynthesis C-methylase UbiE
LTKWNNKRRTMWRYDQSAAVYDTQYCKEQQEKIEVALTDSTFKKENIILDAGCGTGLLLSNMAKRVKLVVSIDVSASIIKQAKKRMKKYVNTALIRADADFTPFMNGTFDIVFAVTLLQNMPTPFWTIKELKRVTKHDSTIIVTGLKKVFSREDFAFLLMKAGLKIKSLKHYEKLKDYVAVCITT